MQAWTVGTRKSKLARIQTDWVVDQLQQKGVTEPIMVKEMATKGDKNVKVALPKLGGGGVFLQELEVALLEHTIDFAVHSLKDIPVEIPEGLMIAAIPEREDPHDALLTNDGKDLASLPKGAIVGTSSLRRAAQLLRQRPDIKTQWIRGPIDSRIAQMQEGKYDAIVLAMAGLNRLGIGHDLISEKLSATTFVPAMGQGALAIECRKEDKVLQKLLLEIHDQEAEKAVKTERTFMDLFAEGEQAPIGGYAQIKKGEIQFHGMVISLDGQTVLEHQTSGSDPALVAKEAADALIAKGALGLIADAKRETEQT